MIEKICNKCNIVKTEEDFYKYKQKNGKINTHNQCKKCKLDSERNTIDKDRVKAYKLKYYLANKHKAVEYNLRQYNLTLSEYNILLESQNYVCKICKKTETSKSCGGNQKLLSVDHCHITGRVRGLLCQKCNTSLGILNEDINILTNMIIYLKDNEK